MASINIRVIKQSDAEHVLTLINKSFPAAINRNMIKKDIVEAISNNNTYGLWVDGVFVATATYRACYDNGWKGQGYMTYLAVDPKHRRKGYATLLVEHATKELKETDSPCLAVSVLAENKIASSFWEKCGFEVYATEQKHDEYRNDNGTFNYYAKWFS